MSGTTALVLGAGLGNRMGGPKVRLVTPHGPLITQLVKRLWESACTSIVIATRAEHVDAVEHAALAAGPERVIVTAVESPEPAVTLAHALGVARDRGVLCASVLVATADSVPPAVSTLAALVAAIEAGAKVATPEYVGRSGHPVACARTVLEQAYGASARSQPTPLREVIRAVAEHRVRVPVADPTVTIALDTPEQFAHVFGASPAFL